MDNDSSRASSIPYAETSADYGRRGRHLCFGRFCDMRVGTIAANSLNVVVRALYLYFEKNGGYYYPYQVTATDYCTLAFSILAVWGAFKYQVWCTASAAVGLTWVFLPRLSESEVWYMFVLDSLSLYPTIMMTYEMYAGTMFDENLADNREALIDP